MRVIDVGRTMSANELVRSLSEACKAAGLETLIIEPSTKVWVNTPNGREHMAELITLRPDADEVLMWWWSWRKPICPAENIAEATKLISNVVAATVF